MSDPINAPDHYQAVCHCPHCGHAIEAISITERFSFVVGNALKYLLRAGRKDGSDEAQDYGKAAWYATRAAKQAMRATERPAEGPSVISADPTTRQTVPGVYGPEIVDCDDAPVSVSRYGWRSNGYSDLHRSIVGPAEALEGVQDGSGLFPRAWTPETDDSATTARAECPDGAPTEKGGT